MTHLEKCAQRMTRTLNRKPRSPKTRAYVQTLPKSTKVTKVHPSDFETKKVARARAVETAKAHLATLAATNGGQEKRRIKLRPKAAIEREGQPKKTPKKLCRPHHRHREVFSLDGYSRWTRPMRDKEVCDEHRRILYSVQNRRCALCGCAFDGPAYLFSLDHVIPLSAGGKDDIGNLALCHGECNGEKSNDMPTGCEMVALLAINSRLGVKPYTF